MVYGFVISCAIALQKKPISTEISNADNEQVFIVCLLEEFSGRAVER